MSTINITIDLPTPDHEAGLTHVTGLHNVGARERNEVELTEEQYLTQVVDSAIDSYRRQALELDVAVLAEEFKAATEDKRMQARDIFKAQAQPRR